MPKHRLRCVFIIKLNFEEAEWPRRLFRLDFRYAKISINSLISNFFGLIHTKKKRLTRYFLGVALLHFPYNAYICLMTDPTLLSLAQIVLPCEVLESFDIVKVESNETEIHIHLDEKLYETLRKDVHFESKGFIPAVSITDFPIRDHKVILLFRRRKWIDTRTGKSFILPLKIAAEGTRYSQEFASFLKETYGHIPGDLPYT